MYPTMHKFNFIALSVLFILSVTSAIPMKPEQARGISKRRSTGGGGPHNGNGTVGALGVSVHFIYARCREPTEFVALAPLPA